MSRQLLALVSSRLPVFGTLLALHHWEEIWRIEHHIERDKTSSIVSDSSCLWDGISCKWCAFLCSPPPFPAHDPGTWRRLGKTTTSSVKIEDPTQRGDDRTAQAAYLGKGNQTEERQGRWQVRIDRRVNYCSIKVESFDSLVPSGWQLDVPLGRFNVPYWMTIFFWGKFISCVLRVNSWHYGFKRWKTFSFFFLSLVLFFFFSC